MAVLDLVPVERITAEAQKQQQIRIGRAVLSLIAAPLYLLGWLVFWLAAGVLMAGKWVCAGVKLGFLDARDNAVARGVTIPGRLSGRPEARRSVGAS